MQLDDYEEPEETTAAPLEEILDVLLADACSRGLTQDSVVYRDLFDAKASFILRTKVRLSQGFNKKSVASFFKAFTASSTSPYAVSMTTGLSLIHI